MKYKLLLVGKGKSLINDFFMQMDEVFDCLTSSMRYADLFGHVKYFRPHAIVFCMSAENRDDTIAIQNLRNHLSKTKVPLILICDDDDYDLFTKLASAREDLLIKKPINLANLQLSLLSFLHQTIPVKAQTAESPNEPLVDSESTLQLLSQLEKALDSPEISHTKRIMIIDDAPGMLKAIKEQLGSEYEVATAISGKIALKYLQTKNVDLILLDYVMPEEDGPAVFQKLLDNPKTAHIPVVFLTGVNDASLIQKALALNPKGYLLKPVDKETLLTKVHEILG